MRKWNMAGTGDIYMAVCNEHAKRLVRDFAKDTVESKTGAEIVRPPGRQWNTGALG